MKKTLLFFTLIISIFIITTEKIHAQTPDWLWAKSAGSNGYDYAQSVATDTSGNSYVTGNYNTGITFDALHSFISTGSSDIYLVKYDAAGNVLWAATASGTDAEMSNSVAVDKSGNVFIAGYYKSATLTFGATVLTNAGGNTYDIFLAKFDPNGNFLWAKSVGGTGDDRAYGVAVHSNGYCYLTGYFVSSTLSFGAYPLTNSGGTDIFTAVYNSGGSVAWAQSASGSGSDYGYAIAVDYEGNCFITGKFNSSTLTFGSQVLTKVSNNDVFIAKYTFDGVALWAKRAGANGDNVATSLAADTSGNCYVTGNFRGTTITFGTYTLTNAGTTGDIFIAKYDPAGSVLWAKSAGGTQDDGGTGVATDKYGYCYLTGYFNSNSINFVSFPLLNSGTATADIFVSEYTPEGNVVWAKSAGGTGNDFPISVAVDTLRNFFIAGYFSSSTMVFDTTTLSCAGTTDMFIVKSENTPLGIYEMSAESSLSVFPNPASDYISVTLPEKSTIEILNISGQVVKTLSTKDVQTTVSISDLSEGIYIIRAINSKGTAVSKFLKQL